jgi:hypothetical protein
MFVSTQSNKVRNNKCLNIVLNLIAPNLPRKYLLVFACRRQPLLTSHNLIKYLEQYKIMFTKLNDAKNAQNVWDKSKYTFP